MKVKDGRGKGNSKYQYYALKGFGINPINKVKDNKGDETVPILIKGTFQVNYVNFMKTLDDLENMVKNDKV